MGKIKSNATISEDGEHTNTPMANGLQIPLSCLSCLSCVLAGALISLGRMRNTLEVS